MITNVNHSRMGKSDAEKMWELMVDIGRLHTFRDPILCGVDDDFSPLQIHTVMWLGTEGPLTMSHLAERIRSPLPACTGVVDRMEKAGLLVRGRDPDDRRVVRVELSDAGSALHTEIKSRMLERMRFVMGALDAQDRSNLLAILGRLVEAHRSAAQDSEKA